MAARSATSSSRRASCFARAKWWNGPSMSSVTPIATAKCRTDRPSMNKNLHVVVLMGGWSSEREVSLTSGKGVAAALRERGWSNVTELDMGRDVGARLAELKPNIVFNALHGTPGEDGTVQGMMDLMGLTYTHSGLA